MKENDVIAIIVIVIFIILILIGYGIYRLVHVARQNMRGTVTGSTSSSGSSGEIHDDD
jgi:nitrate/nitrite transporter NarK